MSYYNSSAPNEMDMYTNDIAYISNALRNIDASINILQRDIHDLYQMHMRMQGDMVEIKNMLVSHTAGLSYPRINSHAKTTGMIDWALYKFIFPGLRGIVGYIKHMRIYGIKN